MHDDDPTGHPITQVPEGPPKYPQNVDSDKGADFATSPDARASRVKRAMEKTADKLGRSKSAGNKSPAMTQSQPSLPASGHRRIFSLNRSKGKERASADGRRFIILSNGSQEISSGERLDEMATAQSQYITTPTSPSPAGRYTGRSAATAADDDSPFITPRSPPFGPTRSVFNIFRGDGSLRAGTQTLIQALQAIPWATDDQDNDDDAAHQESTDSESDEEDKPASWLASSIHTIYRPVARSRRKDRASRSRPEPHKHGLSDIEDEPAPEEPILSDEDIEEDFEPTAHVSHKSFRERLSITLPPLPELEPSALTGVTKPVPVRSGSMATVKVQRRARLAEKLRDIFELQGISEVIAVGEKDIRLRTNQKTIRLAADSIPSRDEWVKAIRRVMFKAQNMGDSVKIAIPYSAIVDIERSTAMDFSETIEVKVIDKGDTYSVDSYFFAYFHDLPGALEQIRDAVRSSRGIPEDTTPPAVIDTTISRSPPPTPVPTDRLSWLPILEAPGLPLDLDVVEKFRTAFAFDEKESLLGYFSGYIFRLLPVYGRLYISSNFFAFKSSGPLTSRTRMILPLRDILSTESSKAFRFGHYGLVVIVRGHEELFFEFADEERRSAFNSLLQRQMEDVRRRAAAGEEHPRTEGQRDALILEEFGPRAQTTGSEILPEPESMSGSLPAVMFTSTSSTFLTFKPKESLHFTFLTIGSRGDVQPYISLAKGLIADGHKCRIATHGEFKEWIEAHGIEFGYVGGDPAELMRICVENGMFTVSFLKESMAKFRGWIDDLLKTSWEACQGTDVLIESPSAMGGYHIAEALGIPYFRAFTMTWSRTRAYPHAFAVPEHKMGGNYNYMSYVLFDQVFWRGTAGQINRWRKNTLGLPSTNLDKMEPHKIPFLYNFSPVVVPPPLDWPEWIRVTGYWFLDDANVGAAKWQPPPDLLEFIDTAHKAKKKVVYIGFGSIVVSDPKAMTRTVVEAIVQSDVYAIMSKGWSDRLVKTSTTDGPDTAEPLPKQIYQISSIPHDWLFKRIDAACHHGGAGTTGASLRAGIPTIIKPFFGDQYFWADRVEALGIGSAVRKLTVPHLTEALLAATTDQKQIDRAKMIGENIRAENGVATAVEAIYRDLEYARSLIKGRVHAMEHRDAFDASDHEHATIRESKGHSPHPRTGTHSGHSSIDSSRRGAVSDWSVISDQEDAQS
ncbi:hypothetical protein EUX98_g4467 [Antrodiella citrinella]|uniref:sterol 3beta-glucosyltransferase n=1 Tax=Antrodiella citrinella TaxID=2447956 RepID=A0A4S4MTY0_9APHY|nr:hypothetical protein EUX98_g4467 [Antrodiella citrinella]